jgi:hypothetical protein
VGYESTPGRLFNRSGSASIGGKPDAFQTTQLNGGHNGRKTGSKNKAGGAKQKASSGMFFRKEGSEFVGLRSGFATIRPTLRSMFKVAGVIVALTWLARPDSLHAASTQDEVRTFYEKFIAAQNDHDAASVEKMIWNSPNFLWVSRGKQIRGANDAMQTYRSYYAGTWMVETDMTQFQAVELPNEMVQILVPITFTRGAAGQPSQRAAFLISQTLFKDPAGWHITTILPVANTQLK